MAGSLQVKSTVEIFPDRVNRMLDTPDGLVGRRVRFVSGLVLDEAKRRIGDTYSGHHPGPRLRDSGKVESVGGAAYAVVFDHPIAVLHHEGSQAHVMPLKTGGSIYYRNGPGRITSGGKTVFATRGPIKHPGTKGNPYMTDAVIHLGLRPSGSLLRGSRSTALFRLRPI